jgi:hypothetical protein
MGYNQPQFLWFLLLGLIPLVIHLVMRLRVQRVRWGATYLLERAIARLEEQEKWKYYLLFAARTLVGLALAYAFARPFLPRSEGDKLASQNLHHVILVDNSYSMTYAPGGAKPVFENGLQLLRTVVERWPRGETYSIYTLAGGLDAVVERQSTGDGQKLAEQLGRLRVRDGVVDTARAVQEVRRRCAGDRLDLILVGDAQASNWDSARRTDADANARALWLMSGPAAEPNLSLTALTVPGQTILKDDLVQLVVRVQCSRQARDPQPVTCELTLPGEGTQRKTATVLPGRFRDVPFDVRFREVGVHAVKIDLKTGDGLPWDNTITASVLVRDRLRLGVCADAPARAFENAVDYLSVIPAADTNAPGLTVAAIPEISPAALMGFDAVVLDNPLALDGQRQATLEAYVRGGGGLLVFGGPNLTTSAPPPALSPLWPARYGSVPAVLPTSGIKYWSIQLATLAHPCFQALDTRDSDGLSGVKIFGYWPAELAPGAESLARLDNGDLWLAGRQLGFGRVLMLTSGLSGIWNNLPVLGSYAHFLHRSLAYVTAGQEAPLNVRRGDEIVVRGAAETVTILTGPLGGRGEPVNQVLATGVRDGQPVKFYAGTLTLNGVYALRTVVGSRTEERLVSVYDDRAEGEVAPFTAQEESRLVEQFGWRILRDEGEVRRYLSESGGGRETYVWLIGLLLVLLFAESWFSWKVAT